MTERSGIDDVLAANRYLVLGTVGADGQPWVTPVFFARLDPDRVCWVSSPDSRHSGNIAHRSAVAITVFDSTVEVGRAEAAYFDAEATLVPPDQTDSALRSLNARLPKGKELSSDDLHPRGPLSVYQADLQRRYLLVRGGDPELRNTVDVRVQI